METTTKMTPSVARRKLESLAKKRARLCDAFIAAGRGHETHSETLSKPRDTDKLTSAYHALYEASSALEIACHKQWGSQWRRAVGA